MSRVYPSRWGYHPCDYETFLLLKKLNQLYLRALRGYAAWTRWARKQPQNRVRRRRIVDERGRKIGSEVIGLRPEPWLCPFFCTRKKVVRHRSEEGGHHCARETIALVRLNDHAIPEAYRMARTPVAAEHLVTALPCSPEEIRRLVAQAEAASG